MKWKYVGTAPCRIGATLVQTGDTWDFAENPGPLWVDAEPKPVIEEVPKYVSKPKPVAPVEKE